jgi:hypothetical protein
VWLEGKARDYAAGVALFEAHGRSGVLKRLLASSCTDYTREVLARELAKLADVSVNDTVNVSVKAPALCDGHVISVPKKAEKTAPDSDFLCDGHVISPPAGDELRRHRRQLFAERDYLHARLSLLPTEKERLEAALQLLDTAKRIQLSYDVEAGRVSAPVAAPKSDLVGLDDAGEIRRLLANLRPLRSKLKSRPDRADKLAEVEADIQLLETKLKPS